MTNTDGYILGIWFDECKNQATQVIISRTEFANVISVVKEHGSDIEEVDHDIRIPQHNQEFAMWCCMIPVNTLEALNNPKHFVIDRNMYLGCCENDEVKMFLGNWYLRRVQ